MKRTVETVSAMSPKRPVYLNLAQIRLPLPGFVSILHRISGVLMVLSLPFLVYLLDVSLRGDAGYVQALVVLDHTAVKLVLMILSWSLAHHVLAGIRYLLIDLDVGVARDATRRLSWAVLGGSLVLTLMLWGGLW